MKRGDRIAGAAVIGLVVCSVGAAALGKRAKDRKAAIHATATVTATTELTFEDRGDGSVAVFGHPSGHEVAVLAPRSNGFVRGVMRGLFRARKLGGHPRQAPFRIRRYSDGTLELLDPMTGRNIDLSSFGHDNQAAFADLMTAAAGSGARHAQR
ncbi:MAG: photosynthetic complex assembly protein PuhC [Myxococcota bacterium]